jgi:hypothetical protein
MLGGGDGRERATNAEEFDALESLAGNDCYELHFADKGDLGVGEARWQWEGHCGVGLGILGIIV